MRISRLHASSCSFEVVDENDEFQDTEGHRPSAADPGEYLDLARGDDKAMAEQGQVQWQLTEHNEAIQQKDKLHHTALSASNCLPLEGEIVLPSVY